LLAHACIGKSTHSHEINEYDCTKEQDFVNWGEPEASISIAICEIARSAQVIRAHSTGFTQRDSIQQKLRALQVAGRAGSTAAAAPGGVVAVDFKVVAFGEGLQGAAAREAILDVADSAGLITF
jgi:hypothetical protein